MSELKEIKKFTVKVFGYGTSAEEVAESLAAQCREVGEVVFGVSCHFAETPLCCPLKNKCFNNEVKAQDWLPLIENGDV